MKHKTFLRKLPVIIGALSIILIAFAGCETKDKDKDKKDAKLTFTLTKGTANAQLGEDGGGLTKAGKNGTEIYYYTADAPNGTKHFTLTAKATNSKGKITYKLHKVTYDSSAKKMKTEDATDADGKVEEKGKVTIKTGKAGFYYLEAMIEASDDYKKTSKKVLLIVGTPTLTVDYIVIDENSFKTTGDTNDIGKSATLKDAVVTAKGDSLKGKKFTLKPKLIIPEAPIKGTFEYKIYNKGDKSGDVTNVLGTVSAEGLATLASTEKKDQDVDVFVIYTPAAPYNTTKLVQKKFYTFIWN